MWDGFDNRKFPRINLQCKVVLEIEGGDDHPIIQSHTENVGVGGIALLSKVQVDRFTHCEICLRLDDQTKDVIECDGKVMWAVPVADAHGETQHYDLGIEFSNLSEEKRNKIRDLVKKHPNLISQRKEK